MFLLCDLQQEIFQQDLHRSASRFSYRLRNKFHRRECLHDTFVSQERILFLEGCMTFLVFPETLFDLCQFGILAGAGLL